MTQAATAPTTTAVPDAVSAASNSASPFAR